MDYLLDAGEFPHTDRFVEGCANKAGIVVEPLKFLDEVRVSFEYLGSFGQVEFVDVDIVLVCAGEEMATEGKFYLFTVFHLNFFVLTK